MFVFFVEGGNRGEFTETSEQMFATCFIRMLFQLRILTQAYVQWPSLMKYVTATYVSYQIDQSIQTQQGGAPNTLTHYHSFKNLSRA